jgi:glycosyltransferase involved in cell wall biosynthesis
VDFKKVKKLILQDDFFDKIFYLRTYQDARLADATPLDHFINIGLPENRQPNPDFDPAWYWSNYPDVQEKGVPAALHFLTYGLRESRLKNANEKEKYDALLATNEFNSEFYREQYDDLSALDESFDLLVHYVRHGQYEGRTYVNNVINSSETKITDEEKSRRNIKVDYNDEQIAQVSATQVDCNFYLEKNPDVAEAGVDPEWHYYACGEKEGRKPNQEFDPVFYYNLNADVRAAGISALSHFRENGIHENRLGISPKDQSKKKSKETKPLLFVGHDGIQAGSEVVLLEVVKWFYENTHRRIKLLLLAPGPVANKYAYYADVYVLPNYSVDHPEMLQSFLHEQFEFIYLNTVVTGRLFDLLETHCIALEGDIVTHIHEMEKVLAEHEAEMQNQLKHTKLWISASPASSITLREKYKIANDKVVTVPAFINPVASKIADHNELQQQARQALGIDKNVMVISGCGTVYWRKGADLFIETARKVKQQTQQPVEFVWIGDGPDKADLESKLSTEEKSYIKFVGNRIDANKLLAAADIFFLSSREDPFPLVVLESAQHSIPTVCFEPATGITAFIEQDAGISVAEINTDLAASAINELISQPAKRQKLGQTAKQKLFANYTTEQQNIKIFEAIKEHTDYQPSVSVIVPFYNHEQFIEERLNSIVNQHIKDIEIIALDDCSTDNTVQRVKPYLADSRITLIQNETNSGSPFKQWEKGIRLANAPIVWIAEGDDTCDQNFLETLLPYFDDHMVNIASAKTEIINEKGSLQENALTPYLNMAYPDKFNASYIKDGFAEINEQLGAMCTLVNASGLLIRKSAFGNTLQTAQTFKICGDWLIYLECSKDGKIAHDVTTKNYFRRHSASQVHKVEGTDVYFKERFAITDYVLEHFTVSRRILKKAFGAIDHEWVRFKHKHLEGTTLEQLYNKQDLTNKANFIDRQLHVGLYVHGMIFSKGGIERLAAQLSNHLVEKGWKVTIFCRVHKANQPVYPLYEAINIVPIFDEHKMEESVKALNSALVHSDIDVFVPMLSEWLFDPIVEAAQKTGIPIVASEHNDPWKIEELWWDHDKRVACFEKVDAVHLLLQKYTESLPASQKHKAVVIPNGVKIPEKVSDQKRENLIVSVGRLEQQKRFDRLIEAVSMVQDDMREEKYRVEIYGEGSLKSPLQAQIRENGVQDLVILKGKSSTIEDVYKKADFFVLPSDFEGLPVTLLEALSFGLPAIGFAECNGPNEIIKNEQNGYLFRSKEDLSFLIKKIIILHNVDSLRMSAIETSKKYSEQNFVNNWEKFLRRVVNEK